MELGYTPEELAVLTAEYRLALEPLEEPEYSLPAPDLLDGARSRAYLDRVNVLYEATTRMATASLFAKRYAYLTIASSLYGMSAYDKGMDYAIGNCRIESYFKGRAWLPKVLLSDTQVTRPGEEGRDAWRDRVLRSIFADNLTKVWNAFAKSVPVSKAVLWENTAIYIFWLYENQFEAGLGDSAVRRVRDDYDYLIRRAPGELFGEAKNPLTRFDSPKVSTTASEQPIRLRKTCCFYYQASDKPEDYCATCPKIKHEVIAPGLEGECGGQPMPSVGG